MSSSSLAATTSSRSSGAPATDVDRIRMLIGTGPLERSPSARYGPRESDVLLRLRVVDDDTRDRSLQQKTKVPGASGHHGKWPRTSWAVLVFDATTSEWTVLPESSERRRQPTYAPTAPHRALGLSGRWDANRTTGGRSVSRVGSRCSGRASASAVAYPSGDARRCGLDGSGLRA